MDKQDLISLKYYIGCCVLLIAFFLYSGLTGWKWFNDTNTETSRPTTGRTGHIYRYHK